MLLRAVDRSITFICSSFSALFKPWPSMTSSTKKKRERKKDFQKPKLKVGKAKPKAVNQTDTSFRAKGSSPKSIGNKATILTLRLHSHRTQPTARR